MLDQFPTQQRIFSAPNKAGGWHRPWLGVAGTLGGGGGGSGPPVTTGLIARWEADAILGLNDGDPVATWPDQSLSARNATQATAANRPLFKTNIFGTQPAVRFDGSNDALDFTPETIPAWTFFVVMTIRTFIGFSEVLCWRAGGIAGFAFHEGIGNAVGWTPNIMATNSSDAEILSRDVTLAATDYHSPFPSGPGITMHRSDGTNYGFRKNGNAITTNAGTAAGYTGFVTAAKIGNGYAACACDIGAILVYNSVLADADVNSLFTYLNTKYGVY